MTEHQDSQNFADLFKRYRLRSQIDTLSRFGDLFAEEGMVYENSLFTRWQKGQRIPKDRRTLLSLISLFVKHKGITSVEEANGLLKSVGLCDLNEEEIISYDIAKQDSNPNQVIAKINRLNLKNLSFKELWNNNIFKLLILISFYNFIWNIKINATNSNDTFESYIWAISYSLISLSAFLYFLIKSRSTSIINKNSIWFKAGKLISFGLLSQGLGLLTWTYYNLTGTKIPYPSFADFGYFSTAIFYLLASIYILVGCVPYISKYLKFRNVFVALAPFLLILFTSLTYMQIYSLNINSQIKLALDILYPLIEISSIFLVLCGIVFMDSKITILKKRILFFLIALIVHFLSEYSFVLAVKTNNYSNGNFNDLLYLVAHMSMSIALIVLEPLSKERTYIQLKNQIKIEKINHFNYFSLTQFKLVLLRIIRPTY